MSLETVTGYPKWEGQLSTTPRVWSIVRHEIRHALNDQWARSALILAFGYAVIFTGQISLAAQSRPSIHSMTTFLDFLGLLRWAGLAVAAIMAGGALLDDDRKGALELYLSRSVTRWSYLSGKVLAVLALTFVTLFGPALIYYAASWFLFENQPDGWVWVFAGSAGYAAMWAIVVSGLGLGVSCLVRSSRAASLILFAGIAGMDIVLGDLLQSITRSDLVQVLSPMSMLQQQVGWLFGADKPYDFAWWWGAIGLAGLAATGWTLTWVRHPRIKGVN